MSKHSKKKKQGSSIAEHDEADQEQPFLLGQAPAESDQIHSKWPTN